MSSIPRSQRRSPYYLLPGFSILLVLMHLILIQHKCIPRCISLNMLTPPGYHSNYGYPFPLQYPPHVPHVPGANMNPQWLEPPSPGGSRPVSPKPASSNYSQTHRSDATMSPRLEERTKTVRILDFLRKTYFIKICF